jgi:nucleotide-binding universal stress UspA family protein
MERLRKILAPTDFSELSCAGLHYAFDLARSQNAEVIVHHIIAVGADWFSAHDEFTPVRELIAEHRQKLDTFLRRRFPDYVNLIEIRQVVEVGTPHSNIVELAHRERADMIVMSTHGRSGLDHLVLGSETERVVARAGCPVVVIPAGYGKSLANAA